MEDPDVCKHKWTIFKHASGDKPALVECAKCKVWVTVSDSIQIDTLKYLKGFQKWISIIALTISVTALIITIVLR